MAEPIKLRKRQGVAFTKDAKIFNSHGFATLKGSEHVAKAAADAGPMAEFVLAHLVSGVQKLASGHVEVKGKGGKSTKVAVSRAVLKPKTAAKPKQE